MRIVVDAMGGDFAPANPVKGAVDAVAELGVEIILVGNEAVVRQELSKHLYQEDKISVVHASSVIEMDEPPAVSVRRKKDSSINIGMNIVKDGKADAFVSAGNTGAVVAAATLFLRHLAGIERAGLALLVPTIKAFSLIIDVGANIDPKPVHLLQYGVMGTTYFKNMHAKSNPSVGLLNIGEEESKGTDFMKETHQLLNNSKLNFIGNVDSKDIFSGTSDIIIADGFVGNVALKVSEAAAEAVGRFLKRDIMNSFWAKIGMVFLWPALNQFKKKLDYSEYGGAFLLGINGVCIIGHGRSSAKAIKNAIGVARNEVEHNINQHIIDGVKGVGVQ